MRVEVRVSYTCIIRWINLPNAVNVQFSKKKTTNIDLCRVEKFHLLCSCVKDVLFHVIAMRRKLL
jgi:hypothetical protein